MNAQLVICMVIFLATIISFMSGKLTLACTAITSMVLYMLTGCISGKEVLGYISNGNAVLIVTMFIVAAGFNRTKFVKQISGSIVNMAQGSVSKVLIGYVIICVVLNQFITSPLTVLAIVLPLLMQTCDEMNISPSKLVFPIGLAGYMSAATIPIGGGATVAAELNGYLEANGYMDFALMLDDPMKVRLPFMIVIILYCIFVAVKFTPEKPILTISAEFSGKGVEKKPALDPFREKCGYIIFILVTIGLMLGGKLGLQPWQITMVGAVLVAVTGVLNPKEVVAAMPISLYLLVVGCLGTAGALANSGAGEMIGAMFGSFIKTVNNNYLVGLAFFLIPFIITQFMNNRAVMAIFYPIAIVTCKSLGANPIGLILIIQSAALAALMTPAAAAVIPVMMSYGGYDIKSIVKMSLLPSLLCCMITVVWAMTVFPLF